MAGKFDITDYKKLTTKLMKVEDGGVYIFKLPIGASAESLVKEWQAIEDKPNAKIMLLPHDTEIYKRK